MSKRIGLFSGTFDPIHVGHVEAALVARGAGELDEVLVMIEKDPQRKTGVTEFKHRQAMLKLALEDFETLNALSNAAGNITFDNTLPKLQKKYPGATFCLIIGSDMLDHLADWPNAQTWLPRLELLVVLRDNKDKSKAAALLEKLPNDAHKIVPAVWSPVSSSTVKKDLAKTHTSDALHANVLDYIQKHELY